MPRHAKAGNLDNALFATEGEFLLILDADQIPEPTILDRVLGYFRDPQVAVVQTPQFFVDVGNFDPLGSQAPLFHGPIQKGKDGWNAAFFCGSNAVLRREALMQLGIAGYVKQVERTVKTVLKTADSVLAKARSEAKGQSPGMLAALDQVAAAVRDARQDMRKPVRRTSIAEITYRFRQRVDEASKGLVDADIAGLVADLADLDELEQPYGRHAAHVVPVLDDTALTRLAQKDLSPLHALASVRALVDAVDVSRSDEAQPILPMATGEPQIPAGVLGDGQAGLRDGGVAERGRPRDLLDPVEPLLGLEPLHVAVEQRDGDAFHAEQLPGEAREAVEALFPPGAGDAEIGQGAQALLLGRLAPRRLERRHTHQRLPFGR
jgi:cellulose synthase (UDP-forming)